MAGNEKDESWNCVSRKLKKFLSDDSGVTASEYAFMIALVSLFLVGALNLLSSAEVAIFDEVNTTISDAVDAYL